MREGKLVLLVFADDVYLFATSKTDVANMVVELAGVLRGHHLELQPEKNFEWLPSAAYAHTDGEQLELTDGSHVPFASAIQVLGLLGSLVAREHTAEVMVDHRVAQVWASFFVHRMLLI